MIQIFGVPQLKNGNGIHIKKKNRGKFTASAKKAGKTVQQHARDVLADPNATPLQKKRANFARNSARWSKKQYGGNLIKKHFIGGEVTSPNYKQTVDTDWSVEQNWKYTFLDKNRKQLDNVLNSVAHKRGLLNILLNEGYVTNMLQSGLTVNPDSSVVARNPVINPGRRAYRKLGNFGLDNLEDVSERLNITGLTTKKPFDNVMKVPGKDKLPLNIAAQAINMKLNDGKRLLIQKYGNSVHQFFKNNPGSEDRMLYTYYKMPDKFKNRLKTSRTIKDMYNTYIKGGLNGAFQQVDNYSKVIDQYFNSKPKK